MTIFERIVRGEIPCHRIWENEKFLAFLDIRPVAPGHSLLIPKKPIDPVFALSDSDFQELFLAAKHVSKILQKATSCERVCLSVLGFEVPHAHIHLIPARSMADFPWPGGQAMSGEELEKIAEKIRKSS